MKLLFVFILSVYSIAALSEPLANEAFNMQRKYAGELANEVTLRLGTRPDCYELGRMVGKAAALSEFLQLNANSWNMTDKSLESRLLGSSKELGVVAKASNNCDVAQSRRNELSLVAEFVASTLDRIPARP